MKDRATIIAEARARLNNSLAKTMNPAALAMLKECGDLTASIRAKRGTLVGIECSMGNFAVIETREVGRKSVTKYLTGWQSYADCLSEMRKIAA